MMSVSANVQSKPYSFQWIVILGLLTALGPLSIDMYLPALPEMAQQFHTTTESIANSLPAYFFGLAIGQLIYGSLSDRIGRKTPLYIGLSLYALASLLCILAPNEITLFIARILQALGGCVGVVIARAAIRDRCDVDTSAQALASMAMILGIAPIIAPLMGSVFIQFFSWHSIFIVLSIIGLANLLLVHFCFEETLAEKYRLHLTLPQIFQLYGHIFKDRYFFMPMMAMALFSGMMYSYLTSASALYLEEFHFSQLQFAIAFGCNAGGIMLCSFLNGKMVKKIGVLRLLQFGGSVQFFGAVILCVAAMTHTYHPAMILPDLFMVVAFLGFTGPNATALALAKQKNRAGMASALMGSVQFAIGVLSGVILYRLHGGTLMNMATTMLFFAVLGMLCLLYLRVNKKHIYSGI